MRFIVYKDIAGEWRWTLQGRNGKIIADSGEGYKNRAHTLKMIERIRSLIDTPTSFLK